MDNTKNITVLYKRNILLYVLLLMLGFHFISTIQTRKIISTGCITSYFPQLYSWITKMRMQNTHTEQPAGSRCPDNSVKGWKGKQTSRHTTMHYVKKIHTNLVPYISIGRLSWRVAHWIIIKCFTNNHNSVNGRLKCLIHRRTAIETNHKHHELINDKD